MAQRRLIFPPTKYRTQCSMIYTPGTSRTMLLSRPRVNQPAPSVIRLSHKSLFPYIFAALFLFAFIDSWRRAGIDLGLVFEAQGRTNLWKFVSGMFPPD